MLLLCLMAGAGHNATYGRPLKPLRGIGNKQIERAGPGCDNMARRYDDIVVSKNSGREWRGVRWVGG